MENKNQNPQSALSALNPQIRIIIASGIYPPDIGGPATYSQLIAREFSKQGIKIAVICYSDVGRATSYIGRFLIKRISRKHNKLIRYWLYFWNLLKLAKNADLIYAQGPLAAGLPAMWVSKILKKKLVVKIVGDYAWEQYQNKLKIKSQKLKVDDIEKFQKNKYDFFTELKRKIQKKVVNYADKIIVPSEFLKKIAKAWGASEDKIKVIYNAISVDQPIPKGKNQRESADIIISAGRSEPWKGMDVLKEIMPDLKKENPKFKLIIATKMPHDELMGYFRRAKMFVLNSGYEGFSHIILEAMAMELPVITTNVCGNPEVVKDGYNGLLVEYNNKEQLKNAILRLWRDNNLREKLIENGKKSVSEFSSEKMINETIRVLELRNMPRHSTGSASGGKLLMITGDRALAQGKKGPFYYMLEEFSKYWERVDIICPNISNKVAEGDRSTKSRRSRDDQPIRPFSNVFIHSSPWPIIFHPWFILKKGLEIYKKEKFDIFGIHTYPPFYNDIGGYLLWKKIKVPYFFEMMHITGYPRAGNLKEWLYRVLDRLFVRFFANKAIGVRTINKKQVPGFLKKAGVDEKKFKYVPAFYIDLEIFKPQNVDKKYDIVFASRLVKNKGIFLLLKAVKELKVKSQKLKISVKSPKLIIIGSGPLKNKIKKYIKKYNLDDNVIFSGWLPGVEDVAGVYNQSKIMVMPSFNEGGPRVCLEAMACKVPVITSRVGVMLDIIKEGENGFFIDWDVKDIVEKIKLLLEDNDLRKKIAENGYLTVQQFERKKAIENYAETYQNLLHSARV